MTRAVSLITTLLGGALASVASVVAEAQLIPLQHSAAIGRAADMAPTSSNS
jgi:hypothetical protein